MPRHQRRIWDLLFLLCILCGWRLKNLISLDIEQIIFSLPERLLGVSAKKDVWAVAALTFGCYFFLVFSHFLDKRVVANLSKSFRWMVRGFTIGLTLLVVTLLLCTDLSPYGYREEMRTLVLATTALQGAFWLTLVSIGLKKGHLSPDTSVKKTRPRGAPAWWNTPYCTGGTIALASFSFLVGLNTCLLFSQTAPKDPILGLVSLMAMSTALQCLVFWGLWEVVSEKRSRILASLLVLVGITYCVRTITSLSLLAFFDTNFVHIYGAIKAYGPSLAAEALHLPVVVVVACAGLYYTLPVAVTWLVRAPSSPSRTGTHLRLTCAVILLLPAIAVQNSRVQSRLSNAEYSTYQSAMPVSWFFQRSGGEAIVFEKSLAPLPDLQEVEEYLASASITADHLPDIYLFILETFREDATTNGVAPNLSTFRKEAIDFTYPSTTCTSTRHIWYSLFHSRHAFEWEQSMREHRSFGGLPLHILKKSGYRIHAISDPTLVFQDPKIRPKWASSTHDWTQSCHQCFGDNGALLDSCCGQSAFTDVASASYATRDIRTIERLIAETKNSAGGNLYLVFLDAAHTPYSWVKELPESWLPSYPSENVPKVKAAHQYAAMLDTKKGKKLRESFKNCYRNAQKGVDHHFGRACEALKRRGQYDDSIIVVVGDHGEALFDSNRNGHGHFPFEDQVRVPLFLKFPKADHQELASKVERQCTSLIDIFPTLIDYLKIEHDGGKWIAGTSIFKKGPAYVVAANPNMRSHPTELVISSSRYRLHARLPIAYDIFQSKSLELVRITDWNDQEIPLTRKELFSLAESEFATPFHQLFN